VGLVLFFAGCRAVSRDRQEAESEWEARQREKSSSAVAKARRNVDTSEPTTVALVSKSEASETSARRDRSSFWANGDPRTTYARIEAAGPSKDGNSAFFELPNRDEDTREDKLRLPVVANLFLDFTNGGLNEPGADATAFSSLGFNYGFPLGIHEDIHLGWQFGGDMTLREEQRFEADITTGGLIRDIDIGEDMRAGGAILGDYRHSHEHADLGGLRFVAGFSTKNGHHLGVRGAYPLNSEVITRTATFQETQEFTTRHDAFWGYDFDGRLGTEVSVGYMADDVNEVVFGVQASYSLNDFLAVAPMGEINTGGDYAVGVSLVYDFGGSRRRSTLTHFGRRAADDFTPFRKRSFPLMLTHTQMSSRGGGVGPGGVGPGVGGPGTPGGGTPGGGTPGGGDPADGDDDDDDDDTGDDDDDDGGETGDDGGGDDGGGDDGGSDDGGDDDGGGDDGGGDDGDDHHHHHYHGKGRD